MRRLMKRLVRRQHKGQSIIVLALGMVALLGFVGITTDISLLFVRYATLRRAVDAAAIAAAGQMRQDRSIATVNLTARSYIEIHGLNPRDVWVESCQNQPRPDNDPITKGMQMAPPAFVTARDAYLNAYDDLESAISGGTVGLDTLKDLYITNSRAYIDSLSSYAEGESDAVIALENAARAALTTLDGYTTDVDITANFVATNATVIAYAQDVAAFLPEDWTDDPEICTADQRKLVRVTAQVESPTVFLRLFGWQNILLEASAVSETAVLDVVIVMDVSESMMFDTVIKDWEAVHMAVAYLPPRIENSPTRIYADTKTILGQMILDVNPIPSWIGFGTSTAETRIPDDFTAQPAFLLANPSLAPYIPPPSRGGGAVNTYADTYETWIDGWFWGEYLLGVPQSEVNRRLFYLDIGQPLNGEASVIDQSVGGPMGTYPAPSDPDAGYDTPRNQYYQVRSFIPDNVTDPSLQTQPREACRVRFYPFSMNSFIDPTLAEMYVTELGVLNADWPSIQNYTTADTSDDAKWSGFVPSFNFYGCCNDPSYALVDRNGSFLDPLTGNPFGSNSNNWSNDNRFDDLVCQPMKQARDATRLFLERVDFLRGDRVGFVTFDKSAYVIDPDGANGLPGFANLSHMIEDLDTATKVLNQAIGVRAEPNYYMWNEDGGIFTAAGPWTGTGTATQFAAGFNQDNEVLAVDYECTNADCPPPPMDNFGAPEIDQSAIDPSYLNYPVAGNCSIQNAELQFPYSRFATRNTGNAVLDNQNTPSLYRIFNPPAYGAGAQALWSSYSNTRVGGPLTTNHSYEKQGTCRGTNIGAALRVGNGALTDPRTTRRAGTVWIMILLSDGAAGASDPVRSNGQKVDQAVPYEEIRRFDWRQRNNPDLGNTNRANEYGAGVQPNGTIIGRGGYGWLGLCPFGTPSNQGQLIKNTTGLVFPFCSDPDVVSRHFCLNNPGQGVGYPDFGSGFDPGSFDRDYRDRVVSVNVVPAEVFDPPNGIVPAGWDPFDAATQTEGEYVLQENTRLGNIFDVDLGITGASSCDPLYDVDDYARDWADFVAGVDEEQSGDAVLPTIFTIGFRLQFEDTPHAPSNLTCEQRVGNNDSPEYDKCLCNLNIEQCLGEELLRYIADAGDNFVIDNDLQQDWRNHNDFTTQINIDKDVTEWGPKDPCENPAVNWFDPATTLNDYAPRRGGQSCGNYYNAPSVTELQQVFDDIASRMFTRLAG